MVKSHYAKWISGGLEELTRSAIRPLVQPPGDNVVQLKGGGS
jgi:hypothetical protein